MRKTIAIHLVAVTAIALQTSCSPVGTAGNQAMPEARRQSGTAGTLYALSPEKPLVASYAGSGSDDTKPTSVIKGANTQLSAGNGLAVDSDNTIYVVVYDAGSSQGYVKLLVFSPHAYGNVAPVRTALLEGHLIPGHAVGLALDGRGNFWLAAIGKLLRFSTSAQGKTRPNASITLELDTPAGVKPANSLNVAVDSAGNVYCSCAVVFQGNEVAGVSEYAIGRRAKVKTVRSFYDTDLPEVPPGSISIDQSGTIYLASSLPNSGVFAYGPETKSGAVHSTRWFMPGFGTSVSSMTTDALGNVYIAARSRVMVFAPDAKGRAHPIRSIVDRRHLSYTTNDYGTLLNVR